MSPADNLYPDPSDDQPYDDGPETYPCPACGADALVVESDSVPSMMGTGDDPWLVLNCGHVITFDPFTGEESATAQSRTGR